MAVQPVNKRVLVKPTQAEEKTAGGIYIPDSAQEKKQEGTIVAVATDIKDCSLAVGDVVLYENFAGTEIKINDQKHIILKAEEILATITH